MDPEESKKSSSRPLPSTRSQHKSISLFYILMLVVLLLAPIVNGRSIPSPGPTKAPPRKFIVVYHDNVTDEALSTFQESTLKKVMKAEDDASKIKHFSVSGIRGTFLDADDDEMLSDLQNSDEVNYIEPDHPRHASVLLGQSDPPGGLRRISHANPQSGMSNYIFDSSAGSGIVAYVVDTGIMLDHTEFQGRATWGANFVDDDDTDGYGHGSHVSGTIGGITYGVAKAVTLVAVKILDKNGQGLSSGSIQALQWIAEDAAARKVIGKAVVNMSLGGPKSQSENAAVAALVKLGIPVVVAAGNDNEDAGDSSPASEPSAITVGAIDTQDRKANFSNFGLVVDLYAPGVGIRSCAIANTTASNVLSGTSMASPHVAGLIAYLMSLEGIAEPQRVLARIKQLAGSTNRVQGMESITSPAPLIVYNGNGY